MRVFVVGTGRCGSTTFERACRHATNYGSGHESRAGVVDGGHLDCPDNWIEVDPHLSFMIGPLAKRYPGAFFVHLQRRRDEVVASWHRRGIRPTSGPAPLINVICQTDVGRIGEGSYVKALGFLYDLYVGWIETGLRNVHSMPFWLHGTKSHWPSFWKRIQAEGDCENGLAEFDNRYNAQR